MAGKRSTGPHHRFFTNIPLRVYRGLQIAAKQNFCSITVYLVRAVLVAFERDGIDINTVD